MLNRIRTDLTVGTLPFALLAFPDNSPDNPEIAGVAKEEKLRPVTREEFDAYCTHAKNAGDLKANVKAFGNVFRGDEDSGGFPEMPYLDTNGIVAMQPNWVRDLGPWQYIFLPA